MVKMLRGTRFPFNSQTSCHTRPYHPQRLLLTQTIVAMTIVLLLLFVTLQHCECADEVDGVEYFLDEDEQGTSLEGSKVPKIPPEIRVLAKHGEFHKTIYDLPNTETALLETHFQLDPYDFAHWNDTHHSNGWERSHAGKIDTEEYHPVDTTDIYLECTSFYPVQWIYEGDGVSKKIINGRSQQGI